MGNTVTVNKAQDFHKLEKIHRKAGLELGLFSQLTIAPLTVKDVKEVGTLRTTSLAWHIGRAVYLARREKTDIMKAIVGSACSYTPFLLFLLSHSPPFLFLSHVILHLDQIAMQKGSY